MKKRTLRRIVLLFSLLTFFYPSIRVEDGYLRAVSHKDGIYTAITYNIHRGTTANGDPSLKSIIKILDQQNADFIALQEVDRYKLRSGFKDQITEISNELNMDYIFVPNMKGSISEYGNAILSRYPILESGKVVFDFKKEPRSLAWAKVKTEQGELYLTSIHLGTETLQREKYFAKLDEFIEKKGDTPVLVMGDFNILPDHPSLQKFHFHVTGNVYQPFTPTFQVKNKEVQIDYIMGKGIKNVNLFTIPSNASDHLPLILQFRFEKSSGTNLKHDLLQWRTMRPINPLS